MDSVKIGSKVFFIAKPVFIILDTLKTETGMDFALGVDEEKMKKSFADMRSLPKIISLMTCNEENEVFDEELAKQREEYFYRNASLPDFVKCLGFFSQLLTGKEEGMPKPPKAEKSHKAKMKLVKPE
jgi:hypothetical protein